jgi:hypothetical protein
MKKFFALAVVVCLAIETADYGPSPENTDAAINEWMKDNLSDPFSAVVEIMGDLKKGWWRVNRPGSLSGPYQTYDLKYGWVLPVRINSKNKLGAYAGFQNYEMYFQGEKIVAWKTL